MQLLHQSTKGMVFLLVGTKFNSSISGYTSYIEWLKFSCVVQKEFCALLPSFLLYTLLTVEYRLWQRTGLSMQFITANCAEIMNERIAAHSHNGTSPSELYCTQSLCLYSMGVQNLISDQGPRPLYWAGSRAARVITTVSGIANHLKLFCNVHDTYSL